MDRLIESGGIVISDSGYIALCFPCGISMMRWEGREHGVKTEES
jgi:hypothetical protein